MKLPYDVLHIGLHKCASTFLQRVGFAEHPEIDLVWRQHKNFFFPLYNYSYDFDKVKFISNIVKTTYPKKEQKNIKIFRKSSIIEKQCFLRSIT